MPYLSYSSVSEYPYLVPYFCKILALLVTQEPEASLADQTTPSVLLALVSNHDETGDLDEFIEVVSVAAAYLSKEPFQQHLLETDSSESHMTQFLTVFDHACTGCHDMSAADEDTTTRLEKLRIVLLTILADITALDSFPQRYPFGSKTWKQLWAWMTGDSPQLQAAACLAIGNIARSDAVSMTLVKECRIQDHLVKVISDPDATDPQLLHSLLSFFKNLAIPADNKPLLGELLLTPSCILRVLALDTIPQVQFAATSLTRLLLVGCASNAERVLSVVSQDTSDENAEQTTLLQSLIRLFERSDAEPTRVEVARSITAICRVLHSELGGSAQRGPADGTENLAEQRKLLYNSSRVEEPLVYLVTQQKWPILRSEAWFVFALMSRSDEGARAVVKILETKAVADSLWETITGTKPDDSNSADSSRVEEVTDMEDGPAEGGVMEKLELEPQQIDPLQRANMDRVDRENALVMCTQIVKTLGDDVPPEQSRLLRHLIKKGTELVVASRSQGVDETRIT